MPTRQISIARASLLHASACFAAMTSRSRGTADTIAVSTAANATCSCSLTALRFSMKHTNARTHLHRVRQPATRISVLGSDDVTQKGQGCHHHRVDKC